MATDFNKLKVVDLKAELKRLGLPQNGLKAELVARLEVATSEGVSDDSAEPAADEATETVSDDAQPSQPDVPVEPARLEPEPAPTQETQPALPNAQDVSVTATDTQAQAGLATSSTDATPLRPAEVLQDSQKRKRRSISPPPSADDIAHKRARQDDGANNTLVASNSVSDKLHDTEPEKEDDAQPLQHTSEVEMEGVQDQGFPDHEIKETVDQETKKTVDQDVATGSADAEVTMADAAPTSTYDEAPADTPEPREQPSDAYPSDLERVVAPSIHPATSALYIKNFMRPLRSQAVKEHLLALATPAGTPLDDNTIVSFYLDTIRTHAFAVFNSISAASRVRTALHDRIWPDETNRKALWVDFMPAEHFADWVDMEEGSTSGRGSTDRYEVVYDDSDGDGNVKARLVESGAAPPAAKPPPPAPLAQPERKPSIPTGPSRLTGIENAPLGPRGFQPGRGPMVHPSRMERLDVPKLSTRTYPVVNYQPVSEELVQRRLDIITAAKTKDHKRDFGKEYKRYYFENGDHLVDRGPEIFLGIRPPHRERERRREQGRGGPGGMGRRGGGGGRGPPGGGGGSRRGPPMPFYAPHGVPRGGDRFRPSGSSASARDDWPRNGDDRAGGRRGNYNRY